MEDKMSQKKTYEELVSYTQELENRLKGSGNREYKSRLFGFIFERPLYPGIGNGKLLPVYGIIRTAKLL